MTYQDLKNELNKMDEAQLQNDVTVEMDDEFFTVKELQLYVGDVLDDGHPYLEVKT